MATNAGKAPVHLWIVGILSLLWNGIGAADYSMTHIGGATYLEQSGFGAETIAYLANLPIWATASWALGVWGAVAGSLLLLFRSRHAATAFIVSLAGVALMTLHSFINPYPAEMVSTGGTVFEWIIKLVAVLLLWYAWRQRAAGVLR